MSEKRKHRSTGKPRGGRREGAGRPEDTPNVLPLGAVSATQSFRHRVPEGLTDEGKALADEAFGTYLEVMRGRVSRGALFRLMAARHVREELCPPIPKKLEHAGANGEALQVVVQQLPREDGE